MHRPSQGLPIAVIDRGELATDFGRGGKGGDAFDRRAGVDCPPRFPAGGVEVVVTAGVLAAGWMMTLRVAEPAKPSWSAAK
jgi:hypothetical protein